MLEEDHVSEDEKARWSGWSPEEGYDSPAQIHAKEDLTNEKLPRRSTAPGLHMGLTMLLNVQKNDYYCSGTESVGFKVGKVSWKIYLEHVRTVFIWPVISPPTRRP